ncbi:MAG: transglutaminase domain-containing protein [Candidatus Omnitrophica bacterium]|nr:transglutaminase domain-containing protein [Candidatus Omnitrophota bacterium]
MSPGDAKTLKDDFLMQDIRLAYQAVKEVPWGKSIPQDIFLNNVLPYASLNERRDDWRRDFHRRFIRIAVKAGTIDRAVLILNKYVFETLHVSYNINKRPKPDQSPYESMQAHYASCTGLSILLTDALRSVGIPARIAAVPMWPDNSGNHTWVEIWDGRWHYVGAGESSSLDQAWFTRKASHMDRRHRIYAASFKRTNLIFPMRWAPDLNFVSAVDVTKNYQMDRQSKNRR